MNARMQIGKWILAVLLLTGTRPLAADGVSDASAGAATRLGPCTITLLRTYLWRDWMPIVQKPGPDHGSPLRVKITLRVENPSAAAAQLAVRAAAIDDQGQSHPLTLAPLPNYRILPAAVAKTYPDLDEQARVATDAKYNVIWDGHLKPGESREVELFAGDGPYLPAGSSVRVAMTWTDQNGHATVVTTPPASINRTD